ncbi:MAG: glycosyltransferase [Candidatus Binatia bacterium]|nr:glycosyltransferase [Candidatus Binatia bacterium]
MVILAACGVIALLMWLGILLHPARPWDFRPIGEEDPVPPDPPSWPAVCVLVPARNEGEILPHTLPALLTQDYPGPLQVIVIDDRSQDGTAEVARRVAAQIGGTPRLTVLNGASLPRGWVGKVWALAQGAAYCRVQTVGNEGREQDKLQEEGPPRYLLLTDADIRHAPGSVRRLVAESEAMGVVLNSRMARLRCVSGAERLLIPPFVFFFILLYPLRWVNDPNSSLAAAAGGCVLLASTALARIGGFACIKDQIIDDISLARRVKALNAPIRLALSRGEIESLRVYHSLGAIWSMVRRTAFTELQYSWVRLAGTVVVLFFLFALPPLLCFAGLGIVLAHVGGWPIASLSWALGLALLGGCTWSVMAVVYRPAVRFFDLSGRWSWTLPLAGVLYGAMTVDSALRYARGQGVRWRDNENTDH